MAQHPTNPFSFSNFIAPLKNAFKSPAQPAGPRKPAPRTAGTSSPFSIPPVGAQTQTLLPPNMSTIAGPVTAPTPSFTPNRAIPQVTAQTPQTGAISTPAVPSGVTPPPTTSPAAPIAPPATAPAAPQAPTADRTAPPTPIVSPETQKAVQSAEQAIQASQKISPEELSTQGDLDKLIESAKTAFINTSNQPIPLEFITGQLKTIEARALNLAEPLERKLARLQSERIASLESSQFSLERADKKAATERSQATAKRTTDTFVNESGDMILFDTQTGQEIQNLGPQFREEDEGGFTLGKDQIRFDAEGNVIARGAGATGDTGGKINDEVFLSLQDKVKFIDEIAVSPGLDSRVGPNVFARGFASIQDRFGAGQDFAGSVRQLTSQEFLDKLINVKAQGATFGALTDREGDALRAAATKINDWEVKDEKGLGRGIWNIDEASFRRELTKIQDLAQRAIDKATGEATDEPEQSEEDELRQQGYSEEQIQQIINA